MYIDKQVLIYLTAIDILHFVLLSDKEKYFKHFGIKKN